MPARASAVTPARVATTLDGERSPHEVRSIAAAIGGEPGGCANIGTMSDQASTSSSSRSHASPDVGEVVSLVVDYARQETVGPLRGAGRWIGFGLAGAFCLGAAVSLLVLGVLRLIQTELAPTFAGRWMSLLPYLIALIVCLIVIAIAASRIGKSSLHRD